MIIKRKLLILIGSVSCFIACIGDFLATFIVASYYPGYSQIHDTMSSLGVTSSPVSEIISTWWIILGLLFILFAISFRKAFESASNYVQLATWLLIFYGLGEGLGSGLFKADRINNILTVNAIIHQFMGGFGILAILIFPLAMKKIISLESSHGFHKLSQIVFISGFVLLILFSFRLINQGNNQIALYKGLWQRLLVLDFYIYLTIIAVIMVRKHLTAT